MLVLPRVLFGILLALLLSGCGASRFVAEVTQFHDLGVAKARPTFIVVPADKAKDGSLEFKAYGGSIAGELERLGFRRVATDQETDFIVLLDYGVGPGEVRSYPAPVYGYYPDQVTTIRGVRKDGKRFSANVFESGGFVPLGYSEVTETLYQRSLTLEMVDAAAWQRGQTEKRYEGRVTSHGPESEIAAVMPLMIQALFLEFPGDNGASRTVVLEPES